MINVNQKVKIRRGDKWEEGVVHFVHPLHRWFSVKHGTEDYKWLTSFKFDEIGKKVRICNN